MSHPCAMAPEVEAAFDGRFGPRELDRVERHLAGCVGCRDLRARLSALRSAAHASSEAVTVAELEHRRARASLLRAAATTSSPATSPWRMRAAGVAVAAAAVAALGVARPWRTRTAPRTVAAARVVTHPRAEVDALDGARWSRDEAPGLEVIHLGEGMLRVRVPHQHPDHRFVVAVPDGEVEVRGTQFLVEVRGGHTARVSVFEGVVAVRIDGDARLVPAGAEWSPPSPPPPPPQVAPSSRPAPPPATPQHRAARPFRRFAEGVDALGRGDFAAAAEAFARFERQRPDDERADDAAWLRAVALRRGGNEAASREAAAHYLATYPSGAHRRECERLARREGDAR